MITNLKIHTFKAWIYVLEIEMRVKQCTMSQVIKYQVPLFPTQTDCIYLTKNLQNAVMENVQCRHLPLVGVSKRDKKTEKCKSRYLWLLSAREHNATEFLFTFPSSIDYTLNYVEFVPVQCQLGIEKIQVGSN